MQEAIDATCCSMVDASNPNYSEQIEQVQSVLVEIGADQIPQLLVFNKVDAPRRPTVPLRMEDSYDLHGVQTPRVFVCP